MPSYYLASKVTELNEKRLYLQQAKLGLLSPLFHLAYTIRTKSKYTIYNLLMYEDRRVACRVSPNIYLPHIEKPWAIRKNLL